MVVFVTIAIAVVIPILFVFIIIVIITTDQFIIVICHIKIIAIILNKLLNIQSNSIKTPMHNPIQIELFQDWLNCCEYGA